VDVPDVLVVMSQPALDKFLPTLRKGGVLVHEASLKVPANVQEGVKVLSFPASGIASENGVPKAMNTALLGALTALGLHALDEDDILAALDHSFSAKPALIPKNRKVYEAAKAWTLANLK
jgi:2-oxoisovalerate ferredoxin oxidoreductase beta subunit